MRRHDDPICGLPLPSTRPDIVIKVLKADAYRALADKLSAASCAVADKKAAMTIYKYEMMSDILMNIAKSDANDEIRAKV